ncbi:phenylalanine--tRNA ligase subunit beta [uncultured Tistrella sp.]|uniref:phenylalanine--tRNA ligase subunit beta n=1 Tax=Tistrella mobilis TaxID=171437 RepID=UPI000C090178|nr:phenylalanine--tRNA ligase subunit beta [uncultured Tistrella sp.]MAM73779.1 phenylalanine--tRNA ligase subunit beta [Tistrella sp.]
MKFTLSWLKDHLDTDADLDRIALALTAVGLEVEEITDRRAALAPFTVAHVISAEKHPDADKLRVCRVDTGDGEVQVVCGAPNARTGMKAVFARSGLTVPGTGLTLKPSKIRGVESNGMLVSMREMGLSDEHDGIIEMPGDAPLGQPFAPVLGVDDPVIEIAITPNRGDCLGVRGIARDLAAAGLGTLKPLEATPVAGRFPNPVAIRITDDARSGCPVFAGRTIRGVTNGAAPDWMLRRLTAVGLRPISVLVDITNYVSLDLGRPLHVFDAKKLTGDLTIRTAAEGESLKALDERTYALGAGRDVVIADDAGVQSLGGIMGGEATGVDETTTEVVLECAWFDPKRIAESGRALSILSDARYRFERTVDPETVLPGTEIATALILKLAGGEASEVTVAGEVPGFDRVIGFRPARVESLGGIVVDPAAQATILTRLGFDVVQESDALWQVRVPSWRQDVEGEADLVEEVLRINGYDAVPPVPLPRVDVVTRTAANDRRRRAGWVRRDLAARGLVETVNYSFLTAAAARRFGGGADELHLLNPISADLEVMRPTPLASLVMVAGRAAARGELDGRWFEVGPGWRGIAPADQRNLATGLRTGRTGPRSWTGQPRPVDVFDAKADILAALAAAGMDADKVQIVAGEAPGHYHPGRSAAVKLGPKLTLGFFGELHPLVVEAHDVKGPAVGFELDLDALPEPKRKADRTRPALVLHDLQPVERDFAFVVDAGVAAEALIKAVRGAEKKLITDVSVFDRYEGERLGAGKVSLAVSVTLQPVERTLTDAEIQAVSDRIVAAVTKATGAVLRG